MKVLLDEMLPAAVAGLLPGHAVRAGDIAVVLVRGSRVAAIEVQVARVQAAVAGARPGTVTRVEPG